MALGAYSTTMKAYALRVITLNKMRVDGPGSLLHHDEGLCLESYFSNMMKAYALRVITLTH